MAAVYETESLLVPRPMSHVWHQIRYTQGHSPWTHHCPVGLVSMVVRNKPDWATMRPGCVSACIDHVTYMERQMDEQMGEMTK